MSDLIRPAVLQDAEAILASIKKGGYFHRHLDWLEPLDWLGKQPFLVLDEDGIIQAFLSCPEEPNGIIWIRSFFCLKAHRVLYAWEILLNAIMDRFQDSPSALMAAIPLSDWFENALQNSGFSTDHCIVNLYKRPVSHPPLDPSGLFMIKKMDQADLQKVTNIDHRAFPPLWQLSTGSLTKAFSNAYSATVLLFNKTIAAYQLSSLHGDVVHIARIAVLPEFQHRGFASALIHDLETLSINNSVQKITVNTQNNNFDSLALYEKIDFRLTKEQYPVYFRTVH